MYYAKHAASDSTASFRTVQIKRGELLLTISARRRQLGGERIPAAVFRQNRYQYDRGSLRAS
jgi:hypothetical protein